MSLPDLGFGSKTNHDQIGGVTYPRYMVLYAERKGTSDSTPADEDPIFGFRGAVTHTTGTDAKVYIGILNGVLPTPEHNITVSNMSAGVVGETDRVTVTPALLFNPQSSAPAAVTGNLYFDSVSGELKLYSGGWQTLETGGGMTAHDLTGALHTEDATGGDGNFLKADSDTTFSWQAHGLVASDVGAYTTAQTDSAIDTDINTHAGDDDAHHAVFEASDFTTAFAAESLANLATRAHGNLSDAPTDAHHTEIHALATTGPHTGTLPWTDLSKTGSSLADLVTRAHSNLSDAPTSAHHVRYANSEAEDVITAELVDGQSIDLAIDGLITTHRNIVDAHHDPYTDAKARTACISDQVYGSGWSGVATIGASKGALFTKIQSMDSDISGNTTPTEVEAIITAELVNGQSIDNAIDSLISTHEAKPAVHHALVTVTAAPLTLSGQAITFKYHSDFFSIGSADDLKVGTDTPANLEVLTWNVVSGAIWAPPASAAHILATTGPHTGTLPWTDLSKTGSSLADLATRSHSNLSDAPTSAHHVRYADSEVESVITAELVNGQSIDNAIDSLISTHAGDDDAHHIQYTDVMAEAVITAELIDGQSIDNAIDALIVTHDVADEHIAHSGVTITAGTGLSGGGTIAASRTINCDITQYTDTLARTAVVVDGIYPTDWDADITHAPSRNAVRDKIVIIDSDISGKTDQTDVEDIITQECVAGQSIDNAIDALILTHKNLATAHQDAPSLIATHATDDDAHHALVTVTADPLTLSGQAITFNYNSDHFSIGSSNELKVGTDTPALTEVLTWTSGGAEWAPSSIAAHDLTSAYHTDSGLTIGHFLKATGATTFAWSAHGLGASDVGAYTTGQTDSAIDTDINTHAGDDDAHHALVSVYGKPLSISAQTVRFNYDITHFRTSSTGNNLLIGLDTPAGGEVLGYTAMYGVNWVSSYGDTDVEDVITAELVNGQSIDLAIDSLIATHATDDNAHHEVFESADFTTAFAAESLANLLVRTHASLSDAPATAHQALASVTALPLTISGQAITFNYNSNYFRLVGNNLEVGTETPADTEILTWSNALGAVWSAAGTGGPGSGTPWDIPVWDATGSSLTDSMISQNSGGTLATVGGALTVSGALKAGAGGFDVDASGNITDVTVAAATVDTDKFLVQDGSQIKSRTGTQVLSDIGASPSSHSHTHASLTSVLYNQHHTQRVGPTLPPKMYNGTGWTDVYPQPAISMPRLDSDCGFRVQFRVPDEWPTGGCKLKIIYTAEFVYEYSVKWYISATEPGDNWVTAGHNVLNGSTSYDFPAGTIWVYYLKTITLSDGDIVPGCQLGVRCESDAENGTRILITEMWIEP